MRCGLIYGEEDDRGISELLGVEVSLELLVLPGLVGLRGGLPVLEAAHVVVVVALGQLPVDPVLFFLKVKENLSTLSLYLVIFKVRCNYSLVWEGWAQKTAKASF